MTHFSALDRNKSIALARSDLAAIKRNTGKVAAAYTAVNRKLLARLALLEPNHPLLTHDFYDYVKYKSEKVYDNFDSYTGIAEEVAKTYVPPFLSTKKMKEKQNAQQLELDKNREIKETVDEQIFILLARSIEANTYNLKASSAARNFFLNTMLHCGNTIIDIDRKRSRDPKYAGVVKMIADHNKAAWRRADFDSLILCSTEEYAKHILAN